jgi:hypothetical protein
MRARSAYCIFIPTLIEGPRPLYYDEKGLPVTYATEREAQLEILDDLTTRLEQYIRGEREFDDAITVEEFIVPVDVWPDGSISTEDGATHHQRS